MEDFYKVLTLESPFRWMPVVREENLDEFDLEQEENDKFSFFNFCSKIVRIFHDCTKKNFQQALEISNALEVKLISLENSQDKLFLDIKDALFHVHYSCKALLAISNNGDDDSIYQLMKKVKSPDEMSATCKAALHAIKATAHSLYNVDSIENSLTSINIALSIDPKFPFWSFLKAFFLHKRRQYSGENPSLNERELLEFALKTEENNPLFMVYMADALRDSCKHAVNKQKSNFWFVDKSIQVNLEEEINKKYKSAVELYKKSYFMKSNCPIIAFRCANGLMRLPPKYQDAKYIKEIVTTSISRFPNSGFGNLIVALYHERISHKTALTRQYLARCVELNLFNGWMNSLRLEFLEDKENSKSLETLQKMLEIFKESVKQEIIISQIISYYVFVESNVEKACEYVLKYYRKGNQGNSLQVHQSCFQKTDGPVSLINVVTDKVKLMMRDRKISAQSLNFFRDFVQQMNFHNVEVLKGKPINLLEKIKKSTNQKSTGSSKNQTFTGENEQDKLRESSTHVFKKFNAKGETVRHSSKENQFDRRSAIMQSKDKPTSSSDHVLKSKRNFSSSEMSVSDRLATNVREDENDAELIRKFSRLGRGDDYDTLMNKLRELSTRELVEKRGKREKNNSRLASRERSSTRKKGEEKYRKLLNHEDEYSKEISLSSSSTDYSSKRKYRKHKKKKRRSESSNDSEVRLRHRSRSTMKKPKRSHDTQSRKSHHKYHSSSELSTESEQSVDRKSSRKKDKYFSESHSDKYDKHRSCYKEFSRKGKRKSKAHRSEYSREKDHVVDS